MQISIIGSAGCGKTTLFQALSGMARETRPGADPVATIDVPDERVDKLTQIFNPKKTVYSRIVLSDTVAIEEGDVKNDKVSAKTIQQIRQSDALILVLCGFDSGTGTRPGQEFLTMFNEFILADMVQIENRLERLRKQGGKKDTVQHQQEEALLTRCLDHVSDGQPLATLTLADHEVKLLKNFQFLSLKPMLVVINAAEDAIDTAGTAAEELNAVIPSHIPVIAASAKIEAELALMSPADRTSFMEDFGITESVRGRIIRHAFSLLNLISFLTVGDDECRAWPVRKGSTAQEAAAAIHTDLAQKFIRAETVSYEDFMCHGGFAECKKKGLWRLEGKTYVVEDGDIISIRAGN